ncbi:hypothetical protein [Microcoleus sp.]|uniref:hypothetical protein n=1 Tax=Microcoleus sp. TaxID=44472 RepID=UPI003593CCDB
MHQLIFTMSLAQSSELIYGNLQLVYPGGSAIDYVATSGCTGWQQPGDEWAIGRGPIPAGKYEIPSTPYWLDTRGIEGWFFHIQPDRTSPDGSVARGEFGIHFDANVPGSAGCVVLVNRDGWLGFCNRMEAIAKSGTERIPLEVSYG